MGKFEKAAERYMEKQLLLQDKQKEKNELVRMLKQFYDLGRCHQASRKKPK